MRRTPPTRTPPRDETHEPGLRSWVELGQRSRAPTSRCRIFPSAYSGAPASSGRGSASQSGIGCSISGAARRPGCSMLCRWRPRRAAARLKLLMALTARNPARAPARCRCSPRGAAWPATAPCSAAGADAAKSRCCCRRRSATTPTSTPRCYHATNVGSMFRPDNPLLPNYKWVPIGYHGRASSVVVERHRRCGGRSGQSKAPERRAPAFGPSRQLDYELEVGAWIGGGQRAGRADPDRPRRSDAPLRGEPAQRLVGAGRAGVGVPAAGAVPGEELRHLGLARGW